MQISMIILMSFKSLKIIRLSLIYSFNKYLLSICYEPDIVSGPWDISVNKASKDFCPTRERQTIKK